MNPRASKCAPRLLIALTAIASILFMAACGSSNSVTINPGGFTNANLSGTYVISISGTDINGSGSFFAIVGTITADGKGHITAGTVDINDAGLGGVFLAQALTASTYNITPDGRGTGSLATPIGTFGLDFVLTSNAHGFISRFGATGSGSGTLDLQGSASQSSLVSLAFSLAGADSSEVSPLGTVGAFTLNSSGTITSGIQDLNDNGSSAGLTGRVLTGSLVLSSGTSGTAQLVTTFGSLNFDVWVIDSTHLKLIETDTPGTTPGTALAGDTFTQQTTFTAGQLVFTLGGSDSGGLPLVAGGFVTTDASGALTNGVEDYNDAGITNTQPSFTGLCSTFAAGRCNLVLSGFSNGALNTFVFAAYPSSGGILLLEIDSLGLLEGAAYAQTATAFSALQGYGLNLSGVNTSTIANGEVDDIAQFNATASMTNNMTGVLDENDVGLQLVTARLTGAYTGDTPATGRGSISATTPGTYIGGLTLEYYVIDSSTVLFIEDDQNQLGLGVFGLQNSAAAAAVRPVVSMIRPVARSHGEALRRK